MIKNITADEIKIIDSLINISSSITNLYQKITDLEKMNQLDSEEFLKYKDYLLIALDVENDLLKEITNDNYGLLIYYIVNNKLSRKILEDNEMLCLLKSDNLPIRRLINTLNFHSKANPMLLLIDSDIEEEEEIFLKDMQDEFYKENVITNFLNLDVINTFLIFLNDNIIKTNDISLKSALIDIKYLTVLLNKSIEEDLIKTDFKLDDRVINQSDMMAYIMKVSIEDYNYYVTKYLYDKTLKQIYKMIYLKNNIKSIKVREALLRSFMAYMNDSSLADISDDLRKISLYGEKEVVDIIHNCILNNYQDKEKQIMLKRN